MAFERVIYRLFLNYVRLQRVMAKVNKAARGKHRWVGFHLLGSNISRKKCEGILTVILSDLSWRLFDFKTSDGFYKCIIKVPLEEYKSSLLLINNDDSLETLTSSGKIRLVRERLGIK